MKENRTVSRILAILELIAKHDEGLTLGEIYRALDMPKATAYDFLQTLYQADAVYYKDPRLKNYVIGSKMFAIGSVYTKNSNLIEAAEHELRDFANRYGRTVFVTKRINDKIVYVFKFQPPSSRILTPQEIGSVQLDFTADPIGRCYLSFDKKVLNPSIKDYEQIRKDRFVLSNPEDFGHICMIAVPVYNFENRVCGVLAASDLADTACDRETMAKDFVRISEIISRRLGYMGHFRE